MRSRRVSLVVASLLLAAPAWADFPAGEPYAGPAVGGNAVLLPWDLGAYTSTVRPESSFSISGRLGYALWKRLSIELGLAVMPGKGVALAYDASVLFHLTDGEWAPYVLAGGGLYHSAGGTLGLDVDPQVHLGVGVRGLVLPWVVLRAEVRDVVSDGLGGALSNNVAAWLGVDFFFNRTEAEFDHDHDGVPDSTDRCPTTPGPVGGCPDTDHDGVADLSDSCPTVAGSPLARGCPDLDGDGVADAEDLCPQAPGPRALQGCRDTDFDGVLDKDDACPQWPGPKELKGCPDRDKDGVPDADDRCPDVAGKTDTAGCPDKDGDGVTDADDACPALAGPKATKGCPDQDGDGVLDADDQCPKEAGVVEAKGCLPPELKKFSGAIQGIQFTPGKAELTKASFPVLEQAATVLKKFPAVRLAVEGHTDTDGSADANLALSQARADAVRTWLVGKGVDAARLEAKGYGGTKPVADNGSAAGRAKNRRVEFTVLGR